MFKNLFKLLILLFLISIPIYYIYAQTASILPPAETQFFDANGNPLSSGTVDFYIPGTFTRKTTWQDAAETIPNTNPVILDAAGKALILGSGSYRQIIKDNLGNLIWDQVTTAPLPSSGATLLGDGNIVGTIKPYIGLVAPAQYLFANGQNISRTTYSTLFTTMTQVSNVTCQSGNPTISGLSDTTQIPVGAAVELSCVPAGTTVLSTTSTTVTLSMNSTVNTSAIATFFPFGNGNGTTTFTLPDMRGVYLAGRNNMGGTAGTKLSTTFFVSSGNPNSLGATGGLQSHTMTVSELVTHNHTVNITDPGHTHTFVGSSNVGGPGGGGAYFNSSLTTTTSTNTTGITATTVNNGTGTAFTIIPPTMTINYIVKVLPDTSIATTNVVTSIAATAGDFTCGAAMTCTGNVLNVNQSGFARTYISATGINFNSGNTDTSISITSGITRYLVPTVRVGNCSASASTATVGLFTQAAGAGTNLLSSATITIVTAADNTNNNSQSLSLTNPNTQSFNTGTVPNLFFRVINAQGAPVTCDVMLELAPVI